MELAVVAGALILGGSLIEAGAIRQEGESDVAAARANEQSLVAEAEFAEERADLIDLEAEQEREAAAFNESQFRRDAEFATGTRRAAAGASGIVVSSGTALLQDIDQAEQIELEAANIRRGGDLASATTRLQARDTRFGANLNRFRAQTEANKVPFIRDAARSRATGTLLSRSGSVLSSFRG